MIHTFSLLSRAYNKKKKISFFVLAKKIFFFHSYKIKKSKKKASVKKNNDKRGISTFNVRSSENLERKISRKPVEVNKIKYNIKKLFTFEMRQQEKKKKLTREKGILYSFKLKKKKSNNKNFGKMREREILRW